MLEAPVRGEFFQKVELDQLSQWLVDAADIKVAAAPTSAHGKRPPDSLSQRCLGIAVCFDSPCVGGQTQCCQVSGDANNLA